MAYHAWLVLIVALSPLVALAQGDAQIKQEIEQLRGEMRQMQQSYESRLRVLEERLDAERQRTTAAEARASETQAEIERSVKKQVTEDVEKRMPVNAPFTNFEYHGYIRSGFGINTKGGDQEVFQAPGALAKYRLGNENDTYIEQLLSFYHARGGPGDIEFSTHVRGSYATGQDTPYDPDNQVVLREAFVQARNAFKALPGASAWGGLRFYRRQDIHINDFYFLDMTGYGGGIEDISLGGQAKLHLAYIGYADDAVLTDIGRQSKQNIDIRLTDIDVLRSEDLGELRFWLNPSYISNGTDETTGDEYDRNLGLAGGAMHYMAMPSFNGFNKLSVQYGFGSSASFQSGGFVPPTGGADDASRLLVTEQLVLQPNETFSMMLAAIYQDLDNASATSGKQRWISLGARPFWHFTENHGLQFEAGWDYVDNDNGPQGHLYKFTIAPTLSFENSFFGRPQIRVFYTHAFWTDGLEGFVGGPTFENATSGGAFGVQVESWW